MAPPGETLKRSVNSIPSRKDHVPNVPSIVHRASASVSLSSIRGLSPDTVNLLSVNVFCPAIFWLVVVYTPLVTVSALPVISLEIISGKCSSDSIPVVIFDASYASLVLLTVTTISISPKFVIVAEPVASPDNDITGSFTSKFILPSASLYVTKMPVSELPVIIPPTISCTSS